MKLLYGKWQAYAAHDEQAIALRSELRAKAGSMSDVEYCDTHISVIQHLSKEKRAEMSPADLDQNSRMYEICQNYVY